LDEAEFVQVSQGLMTIAFGTDRTGPRFAGRQLARGSFALMALTTVSTLVEVCGHGFLTGACGSFTDPPLCASKGFCIVVVTARHPASS
jgi:hypothetical protein